MRLLSLVAVVAGCQGDKSNGHSTPVDAAIGAQPDVSQPIDAPPPPMTHLHQVIASILVPQSNTQAHDYGFDLDGNQTVDNQLGMVIATLAGQYMDTQATMTGHVDSGNILMLADLMPDDVASPTAAMFTIYQGTNAMPAPCASPQDTACRKHLSGSGSFTVDPTVPPDTPLVGSIVNHAFTGGPGHMTIAMTFAGSPPFLVTLLGARAQLTQGVTGLSGTIGGGISITEIDMKVIPAMRDGLQAAVERDCTMLNSPPQCGCAYGTTGSTLLDLFDKDDNCNISVPEVRDHSLIRSLLAPDVTLENQQCLSLGVALTTVDAGFAEPM